MVVLDMSIANSHEVAYTVQAILEFCCCEELQSLVRPLLPYIPLRLETHAPLQTPLDQ